MTDKEQLILELFDIGCVKFGEFTFKSGMIAPIYFDLRHLVSYPKTLKKVARAIENSIKDLRFDLLAGVPYTALPIATLLSTSMDVPMVYTRKEAKKYGTKKLIEGKYKKGDICLVIDDTITNGASKFETSEPLENEGLIVNDFVVLIDREQGGKKLLEKRGYNLCSVFTISEILDFLFKSKNISAKLHKSTMNFIKKNQVT